MSRNWRTLPFWRWARGLSFRSLGADYTVLHVYSTGSALVFNHRLASERVWQASHLSGAIALAEDAALLGHVQQLIAEEAKRRDLTLEITYEYGGPDAMVELFREDEYHEMECVVFAPGAPLAEALWAVAEWLRDNPAEVEGEAVVVGGGE